MTQNTPPRRHWLQFSLRSLLLLFVLISACLGWGIHKVREQGVALAVLKKVGCSSFEQRAPEGRTPSLVERCRLLLGEAEWRDITFISAEGSSLTDVEMEQLVVMPELLHLFLDGTEITDKGLEQIKGLTQLRDLRLRGTQVSNEGLSCLTGLNHLSVLDLSGTQVTDEGLAQIGRLTRLNCLYLENTQVTSAGLMHLQGLKELNTLDIRGSRVPWGGAHRLKKALPELDVLNY